jgi:hypothetical protein
VGFLFFGAIPTLRGRYPLQSFFSKKEKKGFSPEVSGLSGLGVFGISEHYIFNENRVSKKTSIKMCYIYRINGICNTI